MHGSNRIESSLVDLRTDGRTNDMLPDTPPELYSMITAFYSKLGAMSPALYYSSPPSWYRFRDGVTWNGIVFDSIRDRILNESYFESLDVRLKRRLCMSGD